MNNKKYVIESCSKIQNDRAHQEVQICNQIIWWWYGAKFRKFFLACLFMVKTKNVLKTILLSSIFNKECARKTK